MQRQCLPDPGDQFASESSTSGAPPPLGCSHAALTSGTAGNKTDGYDLNGNETSVNINGGIYRFTWDDEDRLAVPGVGTNTYTYNGLGLRVGKTDSTGTYAYVCDGTT